VRIEVREPTLVVLVGAAGSGKSTFGARWFAPSEVLSSDQFREILTGHAADQRATKTAFSIIHREVTKRLAAGRTVVVDATNVERHARRALLTRARSAGVPAVAIVFALPRPIVLARNAARPGRVVDPSVVERHLALLANGLPALADEGFDSVVVLRSAADVESVELARADRLRRPDPDQHDRRGGRHDSDDV
jgi:predicted kinase